MQQLNLNRREGRPNGVLAQIKGIYAGIAASEDYERNQANLRLIQFCVISLSAVATGCVNAFAHQDRLGWLGACLLALAITGFVERFYFTLRHGLTTIYNAGKQRLAATLCYRVIQITMSLNAAVLCVWIVKLDMPPILALWNRWSIAIHFGLALIGVSAVRDSDAVSANRVLEMKVAVAKKDVATVRKAASIGNPLVIIAAKLRGYLDAWDMAVEIVRDRAALSKPGDRLPSAGPAASPFPEPLSQQRPAKQDRAMSANGSQ